MARKQDWCLGKAARGGVGPRWLRNMLALTLLASSAGVLRGQQPVQEMQADQPSQATNYQSFFGLPSGRHAKPAPAAGQANSLQRTDQPSSDASMIRRPSAGDQSREQVLPAGEQTEDEGFTITPVGLLDLTATGGDFGDEPLLLDGVDCAPAVCFPGGGCFYASADLLVWWTDGMQTPPLVTTSSANTPRDEAGVLGLTSTSTLFGGQLNDGARLGGRFGIGYWLTCDLAVDVSYTFLEQESSAFAANQQTNAILARPFFDAEMNAEAAELVAFPGLLNGSVSVSSSTRFDGLDVSLRKSLCCQCDYRLDGHLGYRYVSLEDELRISESLVSLDAASGAAPNTTIDLFDQFDTRNRFNGAVLGVSGEYRYCQWTVELLMKLGVGNTRSEVLIDGATTITTVGGATSTNSGGLLAQDTNRGSYHRDQFTMIPELGAQLNYDINPCWRASVGYTFLYWCGVARAGDQIDPMLNLSQLPPGPLTGAPLPRFPFATSDFWAQGLNFSLERQF